LHHISKGKSQPRRTIALKTSKKLPRILTVTEMQAIVDACDRLRDRFLLCLLWESGVRIREALGLRHADITAAARIRLTNRARKSWSARSLPADKTGWLLATRKCHY
jgi:integrase